MGAFIDLYDSVHRNELILIDGGICQFHLRKDGQITIHIIISIKPGAGSCMLKKLIELGKDKRAFCLVAKCPEDLKSNEWYEKKGFKKISIEKLKSGKLLNIWHMPLREQGFI